MKVEEFFDEVYNGRLSDIDIYNTVEKLTDGYDEIKLNLLCRDFDFYCFMKQEEFLGSFSHEEIEKKMHELEKAGKKVPVASDRVRSSLSVSAYFKIPEHKKIKKEKDWTDEDIKRLDKFFSEMKENQKITLDVEKLMDPHGVEFFSLHRLKSLLVALKRKHTDSIYRFEEETNDSFDPFQKNFKSEKSETFKFFESVSAGELSKLDIQNKVQKLTGNYVEDKLKLLCEEFDEYIFVKYENWTGSFSKNIFEQRIQEYNSEGITLPMERDEKFKHQWLYVSDFFLRTRFGKPISDEEYEKHMNEIFGDDRNKSEFIDTNVLLGGFYSVTGSRSLRDLRDILIELKRKHTDAVYRFDDKELQINNIHPIHWIKGEESLRLFLDTIKNAGLIEIRETDEIIQEHFRQTDKSPQPIKWSKTNRLLIYLFSKLTKAGLVDTMDRQFKLITEHFLDKKGQPLKRDSLKQDFQNMKYSSDPRGAKTIDKIIQELSD